MFVLMSEAAQNVKRMLFLVLLKGKCRFSRSTPKSDVTSNTGVLRETILLVP